MKHKPHLPVPFIILFLYSTNIFAQADSPDKKKSYFKAGLNYLSNAVYFARKDSSVVPYLRPSIGYFDKSGFYVNTGISILISPDEPKRVDLINIDAGYNFSHKNLDAGVYASKFFYSNASFAVASELKGLLGGNASYNLGVLSITAGGTLLFSNNTDYNASAGLLHAFETGGENNKWTITPTAELNAGTQYFNVAYYETRKFSFATTSNSSSGGRGRGHSNIRNSGSGSTTTTAKTVTFYDKNRFTILDYEISLPVNYDSKCWGLYALPVIAIPTNPATYAINNTIHKENLSTAFFVEIGAYIKL